MRRPLLHKKSLGPKICAVSIVFVLSLSAFFSVQVKGQDDAHYKRNFEWNYNGNTWTWNLSIPKTLYDAYKSVPVSNRVRTGPRGYGFLTTTNDYYITMLAEELNETASKEGFGSYDEVSFVLAFNQSLPYTSDSVTTGHDEYPRFPVETLVDGGGDCEDTSILFATITLLMDYGTVYISPPGHLAVGVLGDNLPGHYWNYSGKTYYYCETTGNGWKIGEIPDNFKNQTAKVYTINTYQQYTPNIGVIPTESPLPSGQLSPDLTTLPSTAPSETTYPLESLFDSPGLILALLAVVVVTAVAAVAFATRKTKQIVPATRVPEAGSTVEETNKDLAGRKFCGHCGSSNMIDARFCENCGKQV